MKHKILKSFPGSQDGRTTEQFEKGEERELTPYLAEIAVNEGWAEPVDTESDGETVEVDNKAVKTTGDRPKKRGRPRKSESEKS